MTKGKKMASGRENERICRMIDSTGADIVPLKDGRPRFILRTAVYFVAGILIFMLMWYVVSEIYNAYFMYSLRFPTPQMVFERLGELFFGDMRIGGSTIYMHIEGSLRRWAMGFLLGFSIGGTLGIILSFSDRVYDLLMVPVSIWQMVPSLAWLPVTILLFGFGDVSAVFIISATVIAPIAINIANGIRRVPPVYMKLSLMTEKTWSIRTIRVMVPYSLLDVVAGLRIGMANGWRTLISAEMVIGVMMGLGYTIHAASQLTNYTTAFAALVLICVIGILIDRIILANIERIVRKRTGLGEESCRC